MFFRACSVPKATTEQNGGGPSDIGDQTGARQAKNRAPAPDITSRVRLPVLLTAIANRRVCRAVTHHQHVSGREAPADVVPSASKLSDKTDASAALGSDSELVWPGLLRVYPRLREVGSARQSNRDIRTSMRMIPRLSAIVRVLSAFAGLGAMCNAHAFDETVLGPFGLPTDPDRLFAVVRPAKPSFGSVDSPSTAPAPRPNGEGLVFVARDRSNPRQGAAVLLTQGTSVVSVRPRGRGGMLRWDTAF